MSNSFQDFPSDSSFSYSDSQEAASRRINTEWVLRLALEEIVRQRHDLQIRVLADNRIAGPAGTDILIQIDEYEIRQVLIDAPAGKPVLTLQQLERFRQVFAENPSTDTLILTWTTGNLASQRLTLQIVDYLRDHPQQMPRYLEKAKPLVEVLNGFLDSHLKVWEVALSTSSQVSSTSLDLRKLFVQHLKDDLQQEKERSFRTMEKKIASRQLSEDREIGVISDVLEGALQGAEALELADRLVQPKRRGGR